MVPQKVQEKAAQDRCFLEPTRWGRRLAKKTDDLSRFFPEGDFFSAPS
ncbi:MAG: hypothetical protein ABSF64_23520 [Bryobacteraceae bacterium]|jgi:hypothetical protein